MFRIFYLDENHIDFDKTTPNLTALFQKQTHIVNKKQSQIRFPKEVDQELKGLFDTCEGDERKIKEMFSQIKNHYGLSCEKKIRDRCKTYLFVEKEFTTEEDKMILYYKSLGWTWQNIAKALKVKVAKQVQNRYFRLRAKSEMIDQFFPQHNPYSTMYSSYPIYYPIIPIPPMIIPPLIQEPQLPEKQSM